MVRGAAEAFGFDPAVDSRGKKRIFHHPYGSARVVGQTLSFTGRLDPAIVHAKDKTRRINLFDGLLVDAGIHSKAQGGFESFQSRGFQSPRSSLILKAS